MDCEYGFTYYSLFYVAALSTLSWLYFCFEPYIERIHKLEEQRVKRSVEL